MKCWREPSWRPIMNQSDSTNASEGREVLAAYRSQMCAFEKGRASWTDEALLAYMGKWNAFSADGTQILASADTLEEVYRLLDERGIDPQETVLEPLHFAEMSETGGAGLAIEYCDAETGEKLS